MTDQVSTTNHASTTDEANTRGEGAGRSRRQLLAGGTGALAAVLTAEALARPAPAAAANGDSVVLGQANDETDSTTISNSTDGVSALVCMATGSGVGVMGQSKGGGDGVLGVSQTGQGVEGVSSSGTGVHGQVSSGGIGVEGVAFDGTGVRAVGIKTALQVQGPASFSRSGVLAVAAGKASVKKSGIALTPASFVLATIQGNVPGVFVQGLTLVTGSAGSFTIHLNKAVPAKTKVAWFAVN